MKINKLYYDKLSKKCNKICLIDIYKKKIENFICYKKFKIFETF